jgi:hypothetical protein
MANATNSTSTTVVTTTRTVYLEIILALVGATGLLILVLVQLIVRSKLRIQRLATMRNRVRHDANYYYTRGWKKDPRVDIVALSVAAFQHRIVDRPQYGRVLPAIVDGDGRDARKDARAMLDRLRAALPAGFAHCSMRTAVATLLALNRADADRFVAVFESVLLGVHAGDGTVGDTTHDDLAFMQQFFHNGIMKEINRR